MKIFGHILSFFLLTIMALQAEAIDIERFEVLNTSDGLSQNSVQSIFCDSRGYMWFGTMDGLNRYDGYEFKIFKTNFNDPYSLTNNRIVSIWEDRQGFIWLESHDGHYHYLDHRTERFYSFPSKTEPGNPRNTRITSFLEHEGAIWLGTSNAGIYRLRLPDEDGIYQVETLDKESDGLSADSVRFVVSDPDGGVWVGTNAGLNLYQSDTEVKAGLRVYMEERSFTCGVATDNELFLGTESSGILRIDLQQYEVSALPVSDFRDNVTVMHLTSNGMLVAGTNRSGLLVYDPATGDEKRFMPGQYIEDVFEDSRGNLWVSTLSFGITRIDNQLEKSAFHELVPREIQSLVDLQRQYLFEDSDSILWVATHGGGLGVFNEKSQSFQFFRNDPNNPNSLSSDIAYCVAQDQSGLIWVGTGQFNGGVNKVIPANPLFRQLKVEKTISNLSDNVVRAMMQDRGNNIWLATKSGQLYVYDTNFRLLKEFPGIPTGSGNLPRFNVYALLQDKDGFLWIGSKGGGLARSRKPLHQYASYNDIIFRIYRYDPDSPVALADNNIYALMQDRQGQIWVGTYGKGINLIDKPGADPLTFRLVSTENSNLSSNEVRQIFEDASGNIWVATTFGLNQLVSASDADTLRFRSFFYDVNDPQSLSYNDVVHIFEDSDRQLWFGTFGGGLNRLQRLTDEQAIFNLVTRKNGLISDAVFGILEDESGNLWLSTENGISKYEVETGQFYNFDENNGLQCSNFSEGTCLKLNDGRLLFGTLDGLLVVSNKEWNPEKFQPPVVFTHFSIFNQDVSFRADDSPLQKHINYTDHVVLKYNQSSFSIEYAALSFFDPRKNAYAYTLDGFDQQWYDVRNERKASYTNLPPGEYTFLVRAANWDGTWSDTPRELKITILPPWWRTHLAYVVYVLLFLLVAEVSRRIFTKYNRLRTDLRVERKVNEIKLKFFTNISHEIRTPLTLVLGPLEDMKRMADLPPQLKTPIQTMSNNGKRMLRLINQLLDFRKIQNQKMRLKLREVELTAFVRDICHNFEQMARQRQIRFSCPSEGPEVRVLVDPEKMDSVLFNLLSNAFKFTPAGKQIAVRIIPDDKGRQVSVVVEDEGKGIAREKLPLLFERFTSLTDENADFSGTGIGLAYSYELVKLHHGDIAVKSAPGEGSSFTVNLLLGNAHFSKDELAGLQNEDLRHFSHADEFEPECKEEQQASAVQPEPPETEQTVLLVEDNLEIRNYLASILAGRYQLLQAGNGEEGLALAREKQPDLIVTDLMMPVMDGISMTRLIKNDFALSHIPVVMLTAKSALDDQLEGIESGAEAYVMKPFHSEYLSTVIRNLLWQRQNVLGYFNKNNPFKGDLKITNRDEEFLKNLVELIEKNCQDADFNVDALVKETSLGRTVFYNKVKSLTGMSPVEFLRNTKLQIAAQYIMAGGYSVSEAAYLSGFNDLKYFSKKFKERYNCPPSKFKEGGGE
ncbi:ATP-binding protein [Prolixibacteraceae bacterium A06]|uniref:histidine kinase n=2 Tax=Gaoshiqia sediminis TaxID=2986998 RepID=A0AA42CAW5_9BACT|nr:ATP-binding protein [Gaoshiqia sediminis]